MCWLETATTGDKLSFSTVSGAECNPVNIWLMASLAAQLVKSVPPTWETQVWSLGGEDPLKKEMAIPSSILAWRIPWTEKPGGLQSMGSQRIRHDCVNNFPFLTQSITLLMGVRIKATKTEEVTELGTLEKSDGTRWPWDLGPWRLVRPFIVIKKPGGDQSGHVTTVWCPPSCGAVGLPE